jgi:cation transport ATPase
MVRHAYVCHSSAGRLRLRIPGARHDADSLKRMAHATREVPGVRSAEYNPTTGSLLIKYARDAVSNIQTLTDAITKAGMPLELVGAMTGAEEIAEVEEYSQLAGSISSLFGGLDQAIKYATDNQLDLKILLPIGAAILGFSSLRRPSMSTPLWLTLMLFSFSSFHSLHGDSGAPAEIGQPRAKSEDRYLH